MLTRLVVLIPTRNRGAMACRSAMSVLDAARTGEVRVIISDNSTDAQESALIDTFISQRGSSDIEVIRPEMSLSMTMHWQWAMTHALSVSGASHFFLLTDRMLLKQNALSELLTVTKKYPDDLIAFTYDRVYDYGRPVSFLPLPRSGKLYRLESAKLLQQTARMIFFSCLPRMLNCIAPRALLEAMTHRFGSVFASVSPDFCFCYRVLGMIPSFLYYDKSLLVNYAQDRSNGGSFARGIASKDNLDFERNLDGHSLNEHTPIPEIRTVGNAVIHEYCCVKADCDSSRYPDLSFQAYLDFLAREVDAFLDRSMASAARDILIAKGWRPTLAFRLSSFRSKLVSLVLSVRKRTFKTRADAIRYATTHPSKNVPWVDAIHRRYGKQILPLH